MGSEITKEEAFDSRLLEHFSVNDLVSWAPQLGEKKEYGIIIKIYTEDMNSDRKFIYARVKKPTGEVEPFMLSALTKES
jgi:hypothetical protein